MWLLLLLELVVFWQNASPHPRTEAGSPEAAKVASWDVTSAGIDASPNPEAGGAFEIGAYGFQTVSHRVQGSSRVPGHLWEVLGRKR